MENLTPEQTRQYIHWLEADVRSKAHWDCMRRAEIARLHRQLGRITTVAAALLVVLMISVVVLVMVVEARHGWF
jgi:hypothetical protein